VNGDDRKKTLLPEVLPAPRATGAQSPPERVAERARVLLQRFRGLGTAAGAALISLNCSGYMVVDPLPPPPLACSSSPDPFASITASVRVASGTTTPAVVLVLQAPRYPPDNFVGYAVSSVRVTDGTLISTEDMTTRGAGGGTQFEITIAPASATATILVDVELSCSPRSATKLYSIAHVPAGGGDTLVVTERASADGGID
jgi:hypothetical protein